MLRREPLENAAELRWIVVEA